MDRAEAFVPRTPLTCICHTVRDRQIDRYDARRPYVRVLNDYGRHALLPPTLPPPPQNRAIRERRPTATTPSGKRFQGQTPHAQTTQSRLVPGSISLQDDTQIRFRAADTHMHPQFRTGASHSLLQRAYLWLVPHLSLSLHLHLHACTKLYLDRSGSLGTWWHMQSRVKEPKLNA